jgi:hypothetical protein
VILSNSDDSNGNYSSRTSPTINKDYPHHSTRTPLTYHRHHDDDYPPPDRVGNGNSQSTYYDNHSTSSSRFDRQSNTHDIYPLLPPDQPILSDGPPPVLSYYNSPPSVLSVRDRGLPSRSRSSTYR